MNIKDLNVRKAIKDIICGHNSDMPNTKLNKTAKYGTYVTEGTWKEGSKVSILATAHPKDENILILSIVEGEDKQEVNTITKGLQKWFEKQDASAIAQSITSSQVMQYGIEEIKRIIEANNASKKITFTYAISDGKGNVAIANVGEMKCLIKYVGSRRIDDMTAGDPNAYGTFEFGQSSTYFPTDKVAELVLASRSISPRIAERVLQEPETPGKKAEKIATFEDEYQTRRDSAGVIVLGPVKRLR